MILDSDHTCDHVASELAVYSEFVSVGSYLVVMDTVIRDLPADAFEDRPWDVDNNPWTAVSAFLRSDDRYRCGRRERPTPCNCGAGRLLTPSALKIVTRQGATAIIWGGTGHAKVVHQLLKSLGITTSVICDRNRAVSTPIPGVPIFHTEKQFSPGWRQREREGLCFVAAIGGSRGASRLDVHGYLSDLGIPPLSLRHPTAWIDESATLGSGDQVLAMAAVGVDVSLGTQCIVNTSATVDHDTRIGDGVHLMPGAVVAGQVVIENEATIGTNATILPDLTVGCRAIVGAGAVVTRDVEPGTTVVGAPARPVVTRLRSDSQPRSPWRAPAGDPATSR